MSELTKIEADTEYSILRRAADYGISMPQMMFVLEYVSSFLPGPSYQLHLAGDKVSDATALNHLGKKEISKPEVSRAIAAEITRMGNSLNIVRETLIARAWGEALDMKNKASERLKAIELLSKMIGASDFDPNAGKDIGPKLTVVINDPRSIMVQKEPKVGGEAVTVIDAQLSEDGEKVEVVQREGPT